MRMSINEAGQERSPRQLDDLGILRRLHITRRPRRRNFLSPHQHYPPRMRRRGHAVENTLGLEENRQVLGLAWCEAECQQKSGVTMPHDGDSFFPRFLVTF